MLIAQSVWSSNNWVSLPDLRMVKEFSDEAWKEIELWGTWRGSMHMLFINGSFSIHRPSSTPTRISNEIHYYKFITTIYSWHWWIAGIKLNYGNLLIEIRWLLNFRLLSEVRQWSFVSYLNPVLLRISTLWGFYVIHECSLKWFHSEVMAFLIQSFDEQAFVSTLWEDCWAISSIKS